MNIGPEWHLEAEAIGKGDIFSNSLKNYFIFISNNELRCKAQIPELDK